MRRVLVRPIHTILLPIILSLIVVRVNGQNQIQVFDPGRFYTGLYYFAAKPFDFSHGEIVYDITDEAIVDRLFSRLADMGFNMIVYANAYRHPGGSVFPHDRPNLDYRWKYLESSHPDLTNFNPLPDFFKYSRKYGMEGGLAVYSHQQEKGELQGLNHLDTIYTYMERRFRSYEAFDIFAPSIEAPHYLGIPDDWYQKIIGEAKSRVPGLKILDYPLAVYSDLIIESMITRARMPEQDIVSPQLWMIYKPYYLKMLRELRGMTLMVNGLIPSETTALIHPVNRYFIFEPEPGEESRQNFSREQSWIQRLGTILMMLPDGIDVNNYMHVYHGATDIEGERTLWRWHEWCKGAVSVQRLQPFYSQSRNVSQVVILFPRYPLHGAKPVRTLWTPLSENHIPARFAVEPPNEDPTIIILPSIYGLSEQQAKYVESFVEKGGRAFLQIDEQPHDFIEREIEKLGYKSAFRTLQPEIRKMLGSENGRVPKTLREYKYGEGHFVLFDETPAQITDFVTHVQSSLTRDVEIQNLPQSYMYEHHRKSRSDIRHDLLLFLSAIEGITATEVEVIIDTEYQEPEFVYISDSSLTVLDAEQQPDGKYKMALPAIGEWGAVIITQSSYPVIMPMRKNIHTAAGNAVEIPVRLYNLYNHAVNDTMRVVLPGRWNCPPKGKFITMESGMDTTITWSIQVPNSVVRDIFPVQFRYAGFTQRTLLLPEDGKERVLTHRTPPSVGESATDVDTAGPDDKVQPADQFIPKDWISVTAGEQGDKNPLKKAPGVSFSPYVGWYAPEQHLGKRARFGRAGRYSGTPFIHVNNPPPEKDCELRVEFHATKPGSLMINTGNHWEALGDIPKTEGWTTRSYRIPDSLYHDYDHGYPGTTSYNLQVIFHSLGIYVHTVGVRAR